MSVSEKLEPLVAGGRKPVDVAAIESELAAIWRSATRPGHGDDAVVRACLWNVVVHTVDGAEADEAEEELTELSMSIPCRAILVRTDAGSPEHGISAWIAANCRRTEDGRRHVCCEEIIVAARGRTMSELPALVRALLAPDVPSALVWMEGPSLAGRHLPEWCESVDRMVYDSARFESASELPFLLSALAGMPRRPRLGDLNWRRLRPWRALLARLYEQAELREVLRGARRIVFGGNTGTMNQAAALFAGWFAGRLGCTAAPRALIFPGRPAAAIEFESAPCDASADGLGRVRFEGENRMLELFRENGRIDMRDDNVASLPEALQYPAPERTRIALLAEELEDYGGDPLLAEAAALAATFLE